MQKPLMEEIEVLAPLGDGACGRVYRARDAAGEDVVLKVFHEPSVLRDLLRESMWRLQEGGWPDGVLPVLAADFDEVPCVRLTPALLDVAVDGAVVPRSLQHHLEDHAGALAAEGVVRGVAAALAGMHQRGVVHGNLKPCNVMFGKGGGVFLTDWNLGNMPGVQEFHFTDALLYQPPEQLRHSVSMEEAGLRWDVFAFGVLAFRLLAGRFPRCDVTYQKVAPPSGRACGDARLMVDLEKVAANLWREPEVVWPDDCLLTVDPVLREIVDKCLALEWGKRPASMVQVAELLGEEVPLFEVKRAGRRGWAVPAWAWRVGFAALVVVSVMLGVVAVRNSQRWQEAVVARDEQLRIGKQKESLWELEKQKLVEEHEQAAIVRTAAQDEVEKARTAAQDEVMEARAGARAEVEKMRSDLRQEEELGRARLEASREIGDQLFSWAMEKGHRRLPPLDGRELRLKRLEKYFVDFLEKTSDGKELAEERARARLQLAEISLAAGDAVMATSRLEEAFRVMSDVPMDGEMRMRMATNRVLLAILKQSHSAADASAAFVLARKALEEIPREGADQTRIDRLMAALDIHEAELLSAGGKEDEALAQLMRASQTLNRLADVQPDVAMLRSELAACHLSSASIHEGIGNFVDAREVRILAKGVLEKLLEKSPNDMALKLELAGCVGAMAEGGLLAGDITAAESLSREAMVHLDEILLRQPDNVDAIVRRAAQLGFRAGILRDRGFAEEAKEDYDAGIRMLERLRASAMGPSFVSYRLALLLWQSGKMAGTDGNRSREIELLGKARSLLAELKAGNGGAGLRTEQIQLSAVYVLGDLGHALQMDGQKEKALEVFREALVLWESLSQSRPRSEEYSEGLVWCRQRVKELE